MKPGSSAPRPGQSLYPCGRPLREFPRPLRLIVLGATGSIGTQTLDLVKRHPDKLQVVAVGCRSRVGDLAHLLRDLAAACPTHEKPLVAVTDPAAHAEAERLPEMANRLLEPGPQGLVAAVTDATDAHCLVNGLVGAVGLEPTLAAAGRGLRIALANKESLVVGGSLVAEAVAAGGAEILPVDSEHAAIAQCLSGRREEEIARLILTASGGPFRQTSAEDLADVTLEQVLKHPTWNMGPKITVDSATMMNKGLEIIEAHHLFGLPYDDIEVVVHPGSIVHSLVEFVDGALLAQLGTPDMRIPLQYAISGEKHWPLETGRLDLLETGSLLFEAPDPERFPCLRLAREAGAAGGSAPIVLNAANEEAVAALLDRRILFGDIPNIIEDCLAAEAPGEVPDLATALAVDKQARRTAAGHIDRRSAAGK
ncbi:MAG: 1-deoxy-D-xylulose-5-phosphate reductoisomerase [Candidatus Krumholzibacteriota bacterium]